MRIFLCLCYNSSKGGVNDGIADLRACDAGGDDAGRDYWFCGECVGVAGAQYVFATEDGGGGVDADCGGAGGDSGVSGAASGELARGGSYCGVCALRNACRFSGDECAAGAGDEGCAGHVRGGDGGEGAGRRCARKEVVS